MITVRDIITEALSRSNLVSRRQQAPADMFESAYQLLKGAARKFSNDNLLQFLICECSAPLAKREFVLGEVDESDPSQYETVDIAAPSIQKVNKVYWRSTQAGGLGSYIELQYASPDDFDSYPNGSGIYTAQPINDLQIMLKTKLLPTTATELKITYNKKWDFDRDTELRIPEQYVELFIQALTVKLAVAFPRLSTEQVTLLQKDLDDMIKNVQTSTRAVKYLSRRNSIPAVNRADFISGRMFLNY